MSIADYNITQFHLIDIFFAFNNNNYSVVESKFKILCTNGRGTTRKRKEADNKGGIHNDSRIKHCDEYESISLGKIISRKFHNF